MPHTPRIRTLGLATAALLLLAATVAVAQPSLLPSRALAFGAREHHDIPDGNSTLTAHVGMMENGTAAPAPGVHVTIYQLTRERPHREPVTRGETDAAGAASFELPNGYYGVVAEHGSSIARKMVRLGEDKDVRLLLHEKGDRGDHQQPGPYAIGVRALYRTDAGMAPAAGADLVLEQYVRSEDAPRNGTWETVATGVTDENGLWTGIMDRGAYRVTVTDDSGLSGERRGIVHHDSWVRVGLVERAEQDQ